MKRLLFFVLFSLWYGAAFSQPKPFRFAFISDTHIGSPNGGAEEDLRRTVADINAMTDIAFVVITGDITELGTNEELRLAKRILDSLDVPYYIIPGNHDTGWSESGGLGFSRVFGNDKFHFQFNGIHFLGCASGPYVRMSDGHVPRGHVNWLQQELRSLKKGEPVVFLNHYPIDSGLDNWYEVIDLLKQKNTILALCGHGHSNRPVKAEDIPAVMGRSNLRAKAAEGGYNLVDVRGDSILFTERKPVSRSEKQWTGVILRRHDYATHKAYPRPKYDVNETYGFVKRRWTWSSAANIISTPAIINGLAVVGNQEGTVEAIDMKSGKRKWKYQTGGPVFSSPAVASNRIVLGSADGQVYCLNEKGKLVWKTGTEAAVLGSPLLEDSVVYIGGSDHRFRALSLRDGRTLWSYDSLKGPVTSKPVRSGHLLIWGAWDTHLYAFDLRSGTLAWKWNNGSRVANYSPAACVPVVKDQVVYVVAPDRYLSAIDLPTGATLWRTNEATVRESLGISEDGSLLYGKTMQDTVVAFYTGRQKQAAAWKLHAGYGYEHSPSMLIEKEGRLFFGTRNGVVYAVSPSSRTVLWAHKIDNSMVNTLQVLNGRQVLASTMDGKLCLLEVQDLPAPPVNQP